MYCDWPSVGRCCFCLPLRKGILGFGYFNLIYSILWMSVYSYAVHNGTWMFSMYHGTSLEMPEEVCIFLYLLEAAFTIVLIYGTHKQLALYIKIYYYFAVITIVTTPLLQIIDICMSQTRIVMHIFELGPILFAALCINIYLLIAVRSLLKKMEMGRDHQHENPLQQIVYEGTLSDTNRVYNDITAPENV